MAIETLRFRDEPSDVSSNLTWTKYPSKGGSHWANMSDDADGTYVWCTAGGVDDNYKVTLPVADILSVSRVNVRLMLKQVTYNTHDPRVRVRVYKYTTLIYTKTATLPPVAAPTEYNFHFIDVSLDETEADNLNFRLEEITTAPLGGFSVQISEAYVDIDYEDSEPRDSEHEAYTPHEAVQGCVSSGEVTGHVFDGKCEGYVLSGECEGVVHDGNVEGSVD